MLEEETISHIFVFYVMPPVLLVIGLFGNILGFIVLRRRRLYTMSARNMYSYMLIFDTIYLGHLIVNFLEVGFSLDITYASSLACKIHIFLNYSMANLSPCILVFISIERYIDIKFPAKSAFLRKNQTQISFIIIIAFLNFLMYLPFPILINQQIQNNQDHQLTTCSFAENLHIDTILSYMDLINRSLLPFTLMIIFSSLLIHSVFTSRNRISRNLSTNEIKTLKKDLKLSVTCITLNLVYIAFSLPISINDFMDFSDLFYTLSLNLFYMSYAVNFYIILISNTLVRRECLIMLRLRVNNQPNFVVRYNNFEMSSTKRSEILGCRETLSRINIDKEELEHHNIADANSVLLEENSKNI